MVLSTLNEINNNVRYHRIKGIYICSCISNLDSSKLLHIKYITRTNLFNLTVTYKVNNNVAED